MRVIEIEDNQLSLAERPIPSPGTEEVLIKVAATGLNRADLFQVAGKYPPPPGASDLPGLEVAGEIIALGEGVTGWQMGDKVAALLEGGGYAAYAIAPVATLLPIPTGLSMIEAASLPEACFTTWLNLYVKGALNKGESVLIHAGASGIGTMAIQCAKALGATVFTTAGSARKCEACRQLGATFAVNYHEQDFVEIIKEATQGEGVNLVIDTIGGSTIERNFRALKQNGRMISLAFLQGAKLTVNAAPLLMKNLTWQGSTLRAQPLAYKALLRDAILTHLWPLFANNTLHPVIDSIFPLEEAQKAHHYMASNQNIGKIMLQL